MPSLFKNASFGKRLDDICIIEDSLNTVDSYRLDGLIREQNVQKLKELKFITTQNISRYSALWGVESIRFYKRRYFKPTVDGGLLQKKMEFRYAQSISPKIIVTSPRHCRAFWDADGHCIAGPGTVILRAFKNGVPPEFLLGILNSRLIRDWLRENSLTWKDKGNKKLHAKSISGIIIPEIESKLQLQLIRNVRNILLEKATDVRNETVVLENEVDILVSRAYGSIE